MVVTEPRGKQKSQEERKGANSPSDYHLKNLGRSVHPAEEERKSCPKPRNLYTMQGS